MVQFLVMLLVGWAAAWWMYQSYAPRLEEQYKQAVAEAARAERLESRRRR